MGRRVGLAVALLASTLLLTVSASPASAATGWAYVTNHGSDTLSVAGAKQRYTFPGTAGQTLFLKSLYKGPYGDLHWRLLAPSGTEIDRSDMTLDIGRVTLSANGTYVIEVYGNGTGTGAYGFTLTAVP